MEFDQVTNFSDENFEESISVREILEKYMVYLKWFVLSVIIFGALAYFKLRYEIPQYNVYASILIKDKDKGSSFTDLSSFENLGLFGSGNNGLENEIQILRSRRLMTRVIKELKLNIRYFIESSPYGLERYPNYPIILEYKSDSIPMDNISTNFKIFIKSDKKFEFFGFDDLSIGDKSFGTNFSVNLGNENVSNKQMININLNRNIIENLIGKTILVTIRPVNAVVNDYMERLNIELVNEKLSKVLTLSIDETIQEKGITLINNLIEQFNADGINDNNEISQNTTDFFRFAFRVNFYRINCN